MKRTYKVKYKGRKYKVGLMDKLYIEGIKLILRVKRLKRRIFFLFTPSNFKLYILLTLLWGIWAGISYYWGEAYNAPEIYTIYDVLWEIKNDYFSSVVLALFIAVFTELEAYKRKIKIQHDLYVTSMSKFKHIFMPFLGMELYHYMPYYNSICLDDTLEYIERCKIDNLNFAEKEFKLGLEGILEQLDKIESARMSNSIIGIHKDALGYSIQYCRDKVRKYLLECNSIIDAKNIAMNLAEDLFVIVADIRRPWRWDVDNNNKILSILDKYEENGIKRHFYYGMHLYGHKFKD